MEFSNVERNAVYVAAKLYMEQKVSPQKQLAKLLLLNNILHAPRST